MGSQWSPGKGHTPEAASLPAPLPSCAGLAVCPALLPALALPLQVVSCVGGLQATALPEHSVLVPHGVLQSCGGKVGGGPGSPGLRKRCWE